MTETNDPYRTTGQPSSDDPYQTSGRQPEASADQSVSSLGEQPTESLAEHSTAPRGDEPARQSAPSAPSAPSFSSPYEPQADAAGAQGTHSTPYSGQQQGYASAGQQQYSGQQQGYPYSGQQSFADAAWSDQAPAHMRGVYTGPITGQPVSDSDAKLWAMLAQLSVVAGYFFAVLGWVGPLVIYLMYKDRNRFVRFHAAEALNGAIAALIAAIVLGLGIGIFTVVTFGLGSFLAPLVGAPAILQIVFAIIGAVKANDRVWWAYPLNLRLFT